MNINQRIENLEAAAAKLRTPPPPPPRFDYAGFSDDEMASLATLLKKLGTDADGRLNLSNATEDDLQQLDRIRSRLENKNSTPVEPEKENHG